MKDFVKRSSRAAALAIFSFGYAGSLRADEPLVRVPEQQARSAVTRKVDPEYPAMARQIRITGRVAVDIIIDTAGNVEKVNILNGNAMLTGATVNAVKRWKFAPITLTDKPVRAIASLTFDFHL